MNPKQTVPLIATGASLAAVAPALLFFAGVGLTLFWLLSDSKGKKLDTPTDAEKGNAAKPALAAPLPTFTPAPIPPPAPKPAPAPLPTPAAMPPAAPVAPPSVAPRSRRNVTREDLATIFNNGTRGLTRTAAVAALKALGFGKTAAYKALSMDGRFAPCLQFSPGGSITWKS
jgi:type IV secretory pathway VirB10-like protein